MSKLSHQHLLRSMDALMQDVVDDCVAQLLRRLIRHTVAINSGTPIEGVSTVDQRQTEVLAALNVKKPTHDTQMSLL